MQHSIGLWIDNEFQKQIKCISKEEGYEDLQEIYENIYTDTANSLTKIRGKIEKILEEYITYIKNEKINIGTLSTMKTENLFNKVSFFKETIKFYSEHKNIKNRQTSELIILTNLIPRYANLTRIYGNNGAHDNGIEKNELIQMALFSFMSFFKVYNFYYSDNNSLSCKHFQNFIYDDLQVIYQTKDDVEEWKRIRFNKLQFNYNLYSLDGEIKKGKIQLKKIIDNEEASQKNDYSKNIYFINLNGYKIKDMYQNLDEIDEEDYFQISQKLNEIETIDMIPLRINSINKNHPYKWDICYLNFSIELNDFGMDLILFLIFSPEKINDIKSKYSLEFNNLGDE